MKTDRGGGFIAVETTHAAARRIHPSVIIVRGKSLATFDLDSVSGSVGAK
jgi:hypothetical protein